MVSRADLRTGTAISARRPPQRAAMVDSIDTGQYAALAAIAAEPSQLQNYTGQAHWALGDMVKARGHLKEAIRLNPDLGSAYSAYCRTQRFSRGDPFFQTVETRLRRGALSKEDRCHLHFAAGKMYDDIGECEQAFDHFRQGNELKSAPIDLAKIGQRIDGLKKQFDQALFDRFTGWGHDSERPIFVQGMPLRVAIWIPSERRCRTWSGL